MRSSTPSRPAPPSRPPSQPTPDQDHRSRLVQGMIAAVTERGYAEVTIADIVRHAHVSKRTFYEHFPDKEACFLAAYVAVSNELLGRIARAAAEYTQIPDQINAAARAYFAGMEERPAITRTFLLDVYAAGPAAIELRRKIHQQFADMIRSLVDNGRGQLTGVKPLSRDMAMALVGGINELMMLAVEDGGGPRLREVADTALQLVWAVLWTLPEQNSLARQ